MTRPLLTALCVACVALWFTPPASAEDAGGQPGDTRRVGTLHYTVPAGFTAADDGEGVERLVPLDEDARFPRLRLHPGAPSGVDGPAALEAWAREAVAEALAREGDGASFDAAGWRSFEAAGLWAVMGVGLQREEDGRRGEPMLAFAAHPRTGFGVDPHTQLLVVEFRDPDRADAASDAGLRVLHSARPLTDPPLEGRPEPGSLDGLFSGSDLVTELRPGFGGATTLTLRRRFRRYAFFPGGVFSDGLPEGGLDGFDYAEAARSRAGSVGTYRERSGAVELRYANGDADTLAREGDAVLRAGPYRLTPVSPAPDGFTFDGSYEQRFGFSAGGGALLSVTTSAFRETLFSRDGRWSATGGGFTGVAGADVGVLVGENPPADRGTYAVSGGELVMRGPGGAVVDRGPVYITEAADEDGEPTRDLWIGNERVDTDTPLPAPR